MKEKKPQKKKEKKIQEKERIRKKNPKIEFLSEISELMNLQQKYLAEENYDEAINLSEKIIRLSIKNDMEHSINEQKEFMNKIAIKVQRRYFISEINEAGKKIEKMYNILLDTDNYSQAHDILELFLKNYRGKIEIESIPIIEKLIKRDFR